MGEYPGMFMSLFVAILILFVLLIEMPINKVYNTNEIQKSEC